MNRRQDRQPIHQQHNRPLRTDLPRLDLQQYELEAQQSQLSLRNQAERANKSRGPLFVFSAALLLMLLLFVYLFRGQIFAPTAISGDVAQGLDTSTLSVENAVNESLQVNSAGNASTEQLGAISLEELIDDELITESAINGTGKQSVLTVEDASAALAIPTDTATIAEQQSTSEATSGSSSSTDVNNGLQPGTSFYIEKRVANEKVANVLFSVLSAEVTADQLILTAAFENTAAKATRFSRIDAVPLEQIRLSDAGGNSYSARAADATLLSIQPANGFAPNGANIGTISFELPSGLGPFTLNGIHDYPPIEISSDMYLNATVTLQSNEQAASTFVPDGNYEIYTQVLSSLEELEPLVLHVRTIDLTQDAISLHIGFSNNTLQQFGLLSGPSGSNAWLLDRVHRQYSPHTVSDSLRNLITPEQGIPPGGEHQGTLTFPRPDDLSELQFVLEPYQPITVRFGPTGLSAVQSSSQIAADNGAASSPDSGVQAYREISALLAESARAIMAQDQAAYLATLSGPMQPLHSYYFERLSRLPKSDFQMKLLFPPQLKGIDVQNSGTISTPTLDAQLRYNLSNISLDNPFVFDFEATFARVDGQWMITNLVPKRNQPFWWGADYSLFETAHFLIFTRPDSVQNLQTLQTEVEVAYAALTALGIPLEQKYVAYFTGAQDSLYALTGMANTNLVGVALSRYDINGIDRSTGQRTINAINRAFYVNSEQFALETAFGNAAENSIMRQSIITHELVHLAFSHDARPFTPPWISEGIAVYYSEQFALDDARQLAREGQFDQLSLAGLTSLETLGDHDIIGQQTELRYLYSGAAVRYLIETYSEAQVLTLFRAYATVPADYIEERMPAEQDTWTTRSVFAAMSTELTDIYVANYFGLTLPELDQRLKEWLRGGL